MTKKINLFKGPKLTEKKTFSQISKTEIWPPPHQIKTNTNIFVKKNQNKKNQMTKKRSRKNKGLKMNRKTFSEISKTQNWPHKNVKIGTFFSTKKLNLKKSNDQEKKKKK